MDVESHQERISFHYEEVTYRLPDETAVSMWMHGLVTEAGSVVSSISYIFCSDEYLLQINKDHLDHDYYTDIITFPYRQGKLIESDIFISIDRVRDNASDQKVPFETELLRVMAHGVLHLLGYKDKTDTEAIRMRAAEDRAIGQYLAR